MHLVLIFLYFVGSHVLQKQLYFMRSLPLNKEKKLRKPEVLYIFFRTSDQYILVWQIQAGTVTLCSCKGSDLNTSQVSSPHYFSTFGPKINSRYSEKKWKWKKWRKYFIRILGKSSHVFINISRKLSWKYVFFSFSYLTVHNTVFLLK